VTLQEAFLIPRAKSARGKVRGALPRTPVRGCHPLKPRARGCPPETPAPFPFCRIFQNGPRRQGCAPPRQYGAPLTAAGRSEDLTMTRKRGLKKSQTLSPLAAWFCLPLVGPELLNNFGVDKPS